MNAKEFGRKLESLCAAHKIGVDTGLKYGNDYVDLVSDKSDPEIRERAQHELDTFFAEHGATDAEPDIKALAALCGLKNTNADRQWLRHQVTLRRLTYKPAEMSAAAD